MNEFSIWLNQADLGRYLLERERCFFLQMVDDIFGFHALQLGLNEHNFLSSCRISRQLCIDENSAMLRASPAQLPFDKRSFDLVVLPHTLDFSSEPQQVLKEVRRVLIPGGHLLLTGFNPYSLWGMRKSITKSRNIPWNAHFFSLSRIKDWLKLLDLEMEEGCFMAYAPPFARYSWLDKCVFIENAGDRWWPMASAIYGIKAIKTVRGMHVLRPEWRKHKMAANNLATAN